MQKWYNIQHIDMSEKMPMVGAANVPPVKYSAAYSTGRERILRLGGSTVDGGCLEA